MIEVTHYCDVDYYKSQRKERADVIVTINYEVRQVQTGQLMERKSTQADLSAENFLGLEDDLAIYFAAGHKPGVNPEEVKPKSKQVRHASRKSNAYYIGMRDYNDEYHLNGVSRGADGKYQYSQRLRREYNDFLETQGSGNAESTNAASVV